MIALKLNFIKSSIFQIIIRDKKAKRRQLVTFRIGHGVASGSVAGSGGAKQLILELRKSCVGTK